MVRLRQMSEPENNPPLPITEPPASPPIVRKAAGTIPKPPKKPAKATEPAPVDATAPELAPKRHAEPAPEPAPEDESPLAIFGWDL